VISLDRYQAVEKVETHIADAVKKDATGVTSGTRVAAFSFGLVTNRRYCALAVIARLAAILSKCPSGNNSMDFIKLFVIAMQAGIQIPALRRLPWPPLLRGMAVSFEAVSHGFGRTSSLTGIKIETRLSGLCPPLPFG
jgi:hypothetical protein